MNLSISKWRLAFALLTGGKTAAVAYILDRVNDALAQLDAEHLARVAMVAKSIANAIGETDPLVPAKFVKPKATIENLLNIFSLSLADGKISADEIDKHIEGIKAAVAAWKEVK